MARPRTRPQGPLTRYVTDEATGCWLWTGPLKDGYGRARIEGRKHYMHRFFYEELVGPIPRGLMLHHRCKIPVCVNPSHLEPMTYREHIRRHPKERLRKLTPEMVADIRVRAKDYPRRHYELAAAFGISQGHLSSILSGKKWSAESLSYG